MFPNMSKADFEVAKLQWQQLQDEATRRRLSNQIPESQRGSDVKDFARQSFVVLIGICLLAVILLQPWAAHEPAVAEASLPAATVIAEEPGEGVVRVVAPAPGAEQ